MPKVLVGSKAAQANLLMAALVAHGVSLDDCATAEQVEAAIGKALKPLGDFEALEQELETAVEAKESLETQLAEAKTESAKHKAKADAFEARLGKLDTGNDKGKKDKGDESGKDKEEESSESLEEKIEAAVAKAVADHYQAAGGGVETVPGDQGKDQDTDEAEEFATEDEYMAAVDKAESEDAREKLYSAMRKKFPLV